MDVKTAQVFEAALRDVGVPRLRLDQVVMVYQRAFPANAMRPDMRARLHDAIIELAQTGIISLTEEEDAVAGDPLGLPHAIEIVDAADGTVLVEQDLPSEILH